MLMDGFFVEICKRGFGVGWTERRSLATSAFDREPKQLCMNRVVRVADVFVAKVENVIIACTYERIDVNWGDLRETLGFLGIDEGGDRRNGLQPLRRLRRDSLFERLYFLIAL